MNVLVPVSILTLLISLCPTLAAAREDGPRRDIRELASRITGGASLLAGVSSSAPTKAFHDRARRFEDSVGRRNSVNDDWREVNSSFELARQSTRRERDPRVAFLVAHLQEDLAEVAPMVGSAAAGGSFPPSGGAVGTDGRISFIDKETCVGTVRSDKACSTPRESLTFRIPRGVTVINRLDGEWRDHGRAANAEIYVNDRLVWRTDVNKDWDGDGKALDVRIPPGSTLTVRSSTGDPIWIRRLTVDTLSTTASSGQTREPWEFPWQNRN